MPRAPLLTTFAFVFCCAAPHPYALAAEQFEARYPQDPINPEEIRKDAKAAAAAPVPATDGKSDDLIPMPELTWASNHLKKIPVGPTNVSFGLHHRTRVEVWDNAVMPGNRQYSNGLVYFRNRLWMDWDLHKYVRVFAQGQDAEKDGDIGAQGRLGEDHADLLDAYVDFRNIFDHDLTVRVGRQPLEYGKQRLVGSFEWANPARRFDAVRVMWKSDSKQWKADAFASKVVVVDPIKINESQPTEEFYGLYATNTILKDHSFDMYAMARMNENGKIADELARQGHLRVYTFGGRAWGNGFFKDCQMGGSMDYEIEGAFQFGNVGKGDHEAGAVHAELGWTFNAPWKPRLMGEFNYASGDDDPTDGDNQTFNNLFPTNHLHYGYMDYFNWSNTYNFAVGVSAQPLKGIDIWAKAYTFSLAEKKDAWRNAGGASLGRDVTGNSSSQVGFEFDTGVNAKLNKHLNAQIGFSMFEGSDFYRDVRPGRGESSRFFYAMLAFDF